MPRIKPKEPNLSHARWYTRTKKSTSPVKKPPTAAPAPPSSPLSSPLGQTPPSSLVQGAEIMTTRNSAPSPQLDLSGAQGSPSSPLTSPPTHSTIIPSKPPSFIGDSPLSEAPSPPTGALPVDVPSSPTRKRKRISARLLLPNATSNSDTSDPANMSLKSTSKSKRAPEASRSVKAGKPALASSSKSTAATSATHEAPVASSSRQPFLSSSSQLTPPPSSSSRHGVSSPKHQRQRSDSVDSLPVYSIDELLARRPRMESEPPDAPLQRLNFDTAWRWHAAAAKEEFEAEKRARDKEQAAEEKEARKKKKKVYQRSELPAGVYIGNTCLCLRDEKWEVSVLVGFEPSKVCLAEDRFVVELPTVVSEIAVETETKSVLRKRIRFLNEPVVKTMAKAGSIERVETGESEDKKYPSDAATRSLTPAPDDTAEVTPTHFVDLTLQQQLYHIRPHLLRVINDEYPPAIARTNTFNANGALDMPTGHYSPAAMSSIGQELHRWAMRDGKSFDGQPQPSRPTGSAKYENYHKTQRAKYCTGVLVTEAVIRIEILSTLGREPTDAEEQVEYDSALSRLETAQESKENKGDWDMRWSEANKAMGQNDDDWVHEAAARKLERGGLHRVTERGRLVRNTEKLVEMYQGKRTKRRR